MRFITDRRGLFLTLFLMAFNNVADSQGINKLNIEYIDYYFENGSPLLWKVENDTLLKISLLPDYQRQTLNRQTDHWYFRIIAEKGTRVRMTIEKMLPDVYNGQPATDWWSYREGIPCYFSYDNSGWEALKMKILPGKELYIDFVMKEELVYLARLPVYTTYNLNNLLERIAENRNIKIINIGKTIEKRSLELIQLGNAGAKYQVILRARAHPWEPGGNWVVEGFIEEFVHQTSNQESDKICFYIMPMANKDGVVRGMTRFNTAGMDLNRKWEKESDSLLCPENFYLEKFIEGLIRNGKKPSLVIDLHNDDKGDIHLSKRNKEDIGFQADMQILEKLMRENTSFSENMRYSWITDRQTTVMTIDNGLYLRYGIESFVYELNANWITGLKKIPSSDDWKDTGKGLIRVLYKYLENK